MSIFRSAKNLFQLSNGTGNGGSTSQQQPTTSSNTGNSGSSTAQPTRNSTADPEAEDPDGAPPAYTPAADVSHGETTIEVGPRRPFQSAPQPPPQLLLSPQPTSSNRATHGRSQSHSRANTRGQVIAEQLASLNLQVQQTHGRSQSHSRANTREQEIAEQLASLNLQVQQTPRRPSSEGAGIPIGLAGSDLPGQFPSSSMQNSTRIRRPPPPRHPSSISQSMPNNRSRDRSDFARDFYSAGPLPAEVNDNSAPESSISAAASPSSPYLAPPGPPPGAVSRSRSSPSLAMNRDRDTSDFALDFYAAGESFPSDSDTRYAPPPGPPPSSSNVPDDGKPTRTYVPGHPLLKDGQTLIYPVGYTCEKCNNTGYKRNDPSHPCRKCWTKYGKPYTGALLYTTWSPPGTIASTGSKYAFQRPLPQLRPATSSPNISALASGSSRQRTLSQTHPRTMSQPHSTARPQQLQQRHMRIEFADPYLNPPPPGALVVPPGDPRLGGQLCWKCRGAGVVPILFLDDAPCSLCGGAGRVY